MHHGLLASGIVVVLIGFGALFYNEIRNIGIVLILIGALLLMQGFIYTPEARDRETEALKQERRKQ